jgi:hypothetical protein
MTSKQFWRGELTFFSNHHTYCSSTNTKFGWYMGFTLSRKTFHLKNDVSHREEEHEGERGNSYFMETLVL